MNTKREHLANFNLAGATYYELPLCFQKLQIGTFLQAKLDPENKFDARAVVVYFEENKLGYIPKSENRIFFKLLSMGYENTFELRIQQMDATEHPENQIRIVAHLIEKIE